MRNRPQGENGLGHQLCDVHELPFRQLLPDPWSNPHSASEQPLVSTLPANIPRFAAVVGKFVTRIPQELNAMNEALETKDFQRLAELAHWLKGSGGTVGFPAFTAPATALEQSAREKRTDDIEAALAELRHLAARIQIPESPNPIEDENQLVREV